ncbi:MAG: 16S rRNA (cytosine(1402)-N(4))-methyltransferase RsmH [Deltaproteobacteria bacterium]|nr:16S rRNA (cytosine(1402)-N(4))-methyltransferase RsmH [Deltaproteobacteria bacterium]
MEQLGSFEHHSVLLKESLDLLDVKPNQDYVDGTLGLGGHSRAILERSSPEGRLLGIDHDPHALAIARQRLQPYAPRIFLQQGNYAQVLDYLKELHWESVDGMILDLGVSSMQLDDASRGFSFLKDAPLDMRMNPEAALSAAEIVNQYSEKDLADIFYYYGEERHSRRIARRIVESRKKSPIQKTSELAQLIASSSYGRSRIHPATRVFQALRIAVNKELETLENFLKHPPDFIRRGGVLVIISFHSLEDRMVKWAFRRFGEGPYEILTRKPLQAQEEEIQKNPRARSAKLRAIKRIG